MAGLARPGRCPDRQRALEGVVSKYVSIDTVGKIVAWWASGGRVRLDRMLTSSTRPYRAQIGGSAGTATDAGIRSTAMFASFTFSLNRERQCLCLIGVVEGAHRKEVL